MNVILVNPPFPQTFWSFEKITSMLGKKALLPPLGVLTVASLFPRSWNFKLVDMAVRNISSSEWDWCDCIFLTGMFVQINGIISTIKEAKRHGKRIVVGGPYAFHFSDNLLEKGADVVVKGEVETIIPSLMDTLDGEETGVVLEARGRPELSGSPTPRYDLLDMSQYIDMAVQFSRGCPFNCEFCDITFMYGRKVRTKTPRQFIRELQCLYNLGWRRSVFVVDDNFIGNTSKAHNLLEQLIPWMEKRKYPFDFYTQVSVNLALKPSLLQLMRRAGFYRVFVGIETEDKEILNSINKQQNTMIDLDEACKRITKAGLQIIAGCIMGFDNERPGADRRLIDFASRNNIPEILATLLQAAPGTALWDRLKETNRLVAQDYNENSGNQTGMINFVPTREVNQITKEFVNLYDVLYEPRFFLDRLYNHFRLMNKNPVKKGFTTVSLGELRAVAISVFRQGFTSSCRWKFWKYLLNALVRFPRSVRHYISSCVTAEHYFEYQKTIHDHFSTHAYFIDDLDKIESK